MHRIMYKIPAQNFSLILAIKSFCLFSLSIHVFPVQLVSKLAEENKPDEAVAALERAIELSPDYTLPPTSCNLIVQSYIRLLLLSNQVKRNYSSIDSRCHMLDGLHGLKMDCNSRMFLLQDLGQWIFTLVRKSDFRHETTFSNYHLCCYSDPTIALRAFFIAYFLLHDHKNS